jgi:hypothetical protein
MVEVAMKCQFRMDNILLVLIASFPAGAATAFSQEPPLIVESANRNGDAVGDVLAGVRSKSAKFDKPIILIAHLGDSEVRRDLNQERMRRICLGINFDYDCKNVILAEGERVKGQGSVDIYVDGKLIAVVRSERNRYLCAGCCDGCRTVPAWDRGSRKSKSKTR